MASDGTTGMWRRIFPGRNPGLWWRSLLSALPWTVVLMVIGAFTNEQGRSRGMLEMGIAGLLVWAVTAVITARASRRRGWGSYLAVSGVLAWILGASVVFETSVQV